MREAVWVSSSPGYIYSCNFIRAACENSRKSRRRDREREREMIFQNFYKVWTSSLQRSCPSRSSSLQCKGGWKFPQHSYFLCIFLLANITVFCMIELLATMLIYVLYNLNILCTILFHFVIICTLLRIFAIKWHPTTNDWFWLLHTFEV